MKISAVSIVSAKKVAPAAGVTFLTGARYALAFIPHSPMRMWDWRDMKPVAPTPPNPGIDLDRDSPYSTENRTIYSGWPLRPGRPWIPAQPVFPLESWLHIQIDDIVPFLPWMRRYSRRHLRADLSAGLTVAALPQSIVYNGVCLASSIKGGRS